MGLSFLLLFIHSFVSQIFAKPLVVDKSYGERLLVSLMANVFLVFFFLLSCNAKRGKNQPLEAPEAPQAAWLPALDW